MSRKKNIINNNRQVKATMALNNAIENDYFMALRQVCISMFDWVDLPESMDQRKLELDLFNKGAAAGLYDKASGVINTGAAAAGRTRRPSRRAAGRQAPHRQYLRNRIGRCHCPLQAAGWF